MILSAAGVFYPVISADLGVQTAEVSAWMSVALLSCAVLSPVVGNLLARFRLQSMMIVGIGAAGAAMALFSVATAPWMLWVGGIAAGYALVTITSLGPATLVNRWFEKQVGFVMGLVAAFTGIGGIVFLMIGQAIIDAAGWRAAYFTFAVLSWAVCIPLNLLCVRERPTDCGLLPYGASVATTQAAAHATGDDHAIRAANILMRTAPFWLLFACGFLMNMVCQINGYFPKYALWVDEQAALGVAAGAFLSGAVLASVCQAGSALGKIGLGAFSDFSVRHATIVLALCGAAGIACVWLSPGSPLLAVGGLVFGFFIAGVLVLLPMLCRAIFGTGEVYPVVYARISVAPTLGGATGNIVWPVIADGLGGFSMVFGVAIVCVAIVLAAALLALWHAR